MRPKASRLGARRQQRKPSPHAPESHNESLGPEDAQRLQERVLERIVETAKLCREIEKRLQQHSAPELDTIIQLHQLLILGLSAQVLDAPELLEFVSALMKPVMEWARIQEKRADRELAREKHKDQLVAQEAASENVGPVKALTDATREKIEHELHLF
jgi:hypothetical protein